MGPRLRATPGTRWGILPHEVFGQIEVATLHAQTVVLAEALDAELVDRMRP